MKWAVILCASIAVFFVFPLSVWAADTALYGDFSEELSVFYDSLPEEVRKRYAEVFSDPAGVETVREETDHAAIFSALRDAVDAAWPSALALFLRLFGMILCAGLFANMKNALGAQSLAESFSLCTALCFALSLTESVESLLRGTETFLASLTTLSSGITPILCAVTAASGHLTGAAVSHAALMLLFTLFENIGTVLLAPMVRASFCFGLVGSIGTPVRLDGITKGIRKVLTVSLSFLMLLISFVIGIQHALARSADSLSLKTVKFALGNMIPLIGGALADAVSTVTGSLSLIRSVTGGIGVLSLLLLLMPILIQLLLHRLVLSVCQAAADMIGCEREAKLIGEVHGTVGFLLAIVALTAVLFLFVLALFTVIGGGGG